MSKKQYTPSEALGRMRDLCARAEHCSGEILEKLRGMDISASDASAILASLRQERYVDDSRFAHAFVRDKIRFARWGRRKVAYALAMKKVDAATVREAIADIDEEEYRATALTVAKAKRRGMEELDCEGKMKIMRLLLSRGYEPDVAREALGKL